MLFSQKSTESYNAIIYYRLVEYEDQNVESKEIYRMESYMPIKKGDRVYFTENPSDIAQREYGSVFLAAYKEGKLFSFSIYFDDGDFEEFIGEAFGHTVFLVEDACEYCHRGSALVHDETTGCTVFIDKNGTIDVFWRDNTPVASFKAKMCPMCGRVFE